MRFKGGNDLFKVIEGLVVEVGLGFRVFYFWEGGNGRVWRGFRVFVGCVLVF